MAPLLLPPRVSSLLQLQLLLLLLLITARVQMSATATTSRDTYECRVTEKQLS